MRRYTIFRAAVLAAALLAALAGGTRGLSQVPESQPQAPESQPQQPQVPTFYRLTGEEGMIQGVISVQGEVPPRPIISTMQSDPYCIAQNRGGMQAEDIVVQRGRLSNVLVYVESAALDALKFEPRPWSPALGHRRCRIAPHVLALQAGQSLYVQNGERTAHNPVFQTKVNPLFNKGLAPGQSFEILFKQPEPPFVVKCNQHPWERGYVAVLPHPYFAVTRGNGTFAIEGLPPGDYEVVVWHESFKEARAKVTVGAKETKVSNFTFKYPADVRPGSH